MPHFEINNLIPVVKDVGNGKQPLGTLFETINLVPNKKTGSLVSRNGYQAALVAPSGLVTLDKYLTAPVTHPSSIDCHVYFFQAAGAVKHIAVKPFFHNGSSAGADNNGWVDIADKLNLSLNLADVTINASPTNTFVLANAVSYSLSTTTSYYKNWILWVTTSVMGVTSSTPFMIEAYSVTAGTATFTLDTVVNIISSATLDKTQITACSLQRYFHYDKYYQSGVDQSAPFSPSYTTNPAGYYTDTAIRFSGGAGSTAGYKNLWYGYIDRTFFNSVSANKYRFQGTYCEQAEVFKPINATGTLTLLKSISQASAYASEVIKNEVDRSMGTGYNWISGGNQVLTRTNIGYGITSTILDSQGEGDSTSNYSSLPNTYTNSLTNAATYKVKILTNTQNDTSMGIEINGQTFNINLPKPITSAIQVSEFTFIASGTTAPTIKIWGNDINKITIYDINVFLLSDDAITLRKGRTLKYYAVYVYDGFQRSDPLYLGSKYLTIAAPKVTSVFRLRLGQLNKRITAIESYCTLEDGDTTSNTSTRTVPLYFIHNIPLCDSDTGWTFDASTGNFEYTDTITGTDFQILGDTWEQRTKRIENSSLTCSYSIAENCAGRIFLAQYYDYVNARLYTNAIRYTNFDKYGVMCPDVLSNVDDEFVSYINAGAGTNITTLFERRGELVIGKEASILRIPTNQDKTFWVPIVISNSVGVLNDTVMQSLGNILLWTDNNGVYRWGGGEVELYGDKVWAQYYRDNKASDQISWIDRYDGSYNISLNSGAGNYFKIYNDVPYPYYQNLTDNVTHVAVIKNGNVYFATGAGVNYLFTSGVFLDGATGLTFTTQLRTGAFTISQNKFVYVKEIEIDLEFPGTLSGTMIIYLMGDDAQITAATVATPTLKRIRFNPALVPARTLELKLNYGGSPLKSNAAVTFNRIGIDYDEVEIFGDVMAL